MFRRLSSSPRRVFSFLTEFLQQIVQISCTHFFALKHSKQKRCPDILTLSSFRGRRSERKESQHRSTRFSVELIRHEMGKGDKRSSVPEIQMSSRMPEAVQILRRLSSAVSRNTSFVEQSEMADILDEGDLAEAVGHDVSKDRNMALMIWMGILIDAVPESLVRFCM